MATVSGTSAGRSGRSGFIDRWIFVFMAVFLTVIVLAGFVPNSINMVQLVEEGQRPPFPMVLHVHAVLMGSWMLLLVTQTVLMARGKSAYHMQLGMAGLMLAPLMVIVGCALMPMHLGPLLLYAERMGRIPPSVAETVGSNLLLIELRLGICFAVLIGYGLLVRKRDRELHKRLMILGTLVPTFAAIDRISWLPRILADHPISIDIYLVLALSPMFVWDLVRQRRIHRAYVIFAIVFGLTTIANYMLRGDPWWTGVAAAILGLDG